MCKIARLECNNSVFNKTMCGACMSMWINTGKQLPDQLSEEEKALAKFNADNDAVLAKNAGPHSHKKMLQNRPRRAVMQSRKTDEVKGSSKQTSSKTAKDVCRHDNSCRWQREHNKVYLQTNWRNSQPDHTTN